MKLFEMLTGSEIILTELNNQNTNNTFYYFFDVWLSKYLVRKHRDLPIVHMILNNLVFVFIMIPLIWYFQSHLMGLSYLILHYSLFFGRYMCLNHEYVHNQIFKYKRLGDFLSVFVLGHAHGLPLGSYYINHVIMHHKGENAWGKDLSSTEQYRRDNVFAFIHYWLRHYLPLTFAFDAIYICVRHRRYKLSGAYFTVCILWFGLAIFFVFFSEKYWISGLWTIMLPLFFTGFFGAIAGWMQHFLLNPKKPRKWFSYDIINSPANSHGFNQGFHNVHHTLGNLHWTELPSGFTTLLHQYDQDDVIIFHTLDNIQIFVLVLFRQYSILAKYLVTTKCGVKDLSYCVGFIKEHLQPVFI